MKVCFEDLIGAIANIPIEIVNRMIINQESQGNKPDVTVFQNDKYANYEDGGFLWEASPEGFDFWSEIVTDKNYDRFFELYPTYKSYIVQNEFNTINDIIARLKLCGGIDNGDFINPELNDDFECEVNSIWYIDPITMKIEYTSPSNYQLCNFIKSFYNEIECEYPRIEVKKSIVENIAKTKFNNIVFVD